MECIHPWLCRSHMPNTNACHRMQPLIMHCQPTCCRTATDQSCMSLLPVHMATDRQAGSANSQVRAQRHRHGWPHPTPAPTTTTIISQICATTTINSLIRPHPQHRFPVPAPSPQTSSECLPAAQQAPVGSRQQLGQHTHHPAVLHTLLLAGRTDKVHIFICVEHAKATVSSTAAAVHSSMQEYRAIRIHQVVSIVRLPATATYGIACLQLQQMDTTSLSSTQPTH